MFSHIKINLCGAFRVLTQISLPLPESFLIGTFSVSMTNGVSWLNLVAAFKHLNLAKLISNCSFYCSFLFFLFSWYNTSFLSLRDFKIVASLLFLQENKLYSNLKLILFFLTHPSTFIIHQFFIVLNLFFFSRKSSSSGCKCCIFYSIVFSVLQSS